ncbi:MAG TPA: hypothetical protein VHN15_02780, partial [Thermoanaerobaculia bacterium]|nr:hypothetical protein [Thermoanaerobaculia bacterium]
GDAPDGPTVDFRLTEGAEKLEIEIGGTRWPLGTQDPVASQIEYILIDEAIRRTRDHYILHAGGVATPQGTCLIVGESGAGKTSLTLWLWASGLRLLTDDLCPILQTSFLPETLPRALHMDAQYSPRLLERIPPRPEGFPVDYYPFPEPAGPAGNTGNTAAPVPPVTTLLVLERGPRAEGELSPLSQAEATHSLLGAVIRNPAFQFERALEDMLGLAAQCRAYRLRASTPEGAGERAVNLLAGVAGSPAGTPPAGSGSPDR